MSRHVFSLLPPLVLVATFASTTVAARPWTRHTIDAADRGLGKRGADGVRLADINGDGRPDVTTGWEQGGAIRVCLNPGPRRSKKPWPGVTVGNVGSPEDAVFADLDGDGQLDVISCCEGRNRSIFVHWAPADRRRQRDAGAWTTAAIPAVAGRQQWMYALPLDVDGDGQPDLVMTNRGDPKKRAVSWMSYRGSPTTGDWTVHRISDAAGVKFDLVRLLDLDADGDLDVLTCEEVHNLGVVWYENPRK